MGNSRDHQLQSTTCSIGRRRTKRRSPEGYCCRRLHGGVDSQCFRSPDEFRHSEVVNALPLGGQTLDHGQFSHKSEPGVAEGQSAPEPVSATMSPFHRRPAAATANGRRCLRRNFSILIASQAHSANRVKDSTSWLSCNAIRMQFPTCLVPNPLWRRN